MMAINKKDMKTIEEKMEEVGRRLIIEGTKKGKSWTKMTIKRLYAYPLLKKNIERYRADIEDIKHEDMQKSKSIVEFYSHSGNGEKPDLEDLRAAKIRIVEMKINRDETEIVEIEAALETVKEDSYYPIIEMRYFEKMEQEDIAKKMGCSVPTILRHNGRLIDEITVTLYGADALI